MGESNSFFTSCVGSCHLGLIFPTQCKFIHFSQARQQAEGLAGCHCGVWVTGGTTGPQGRPEECLQLVYPPVAERGGKIGGLWIQIVVRIVCSMWVTYTVLLDVILCCPSALMPPPVVTGASFSSEKQQNAEGLARRSEVEHVRVC